MRRTPAAKKCEMENLLKLAPLCMMLVACGTAYVAPQSPLAAGMSVRNASNKYASVAVFEDAQECYKSHIAARLDPGASGQFTLPTGGLVAMHVQQLGYTGGAGLEVSMCNIIVTFRPKDGHRYSASMTNDARGCSIDILDTPASGEVASVAVVRREFTPPQGFTNKWCPALTAQQSSQLQ